MAGLIPREFINDLLVRVDIVDLIDSHVPLKKTGTNYVARCPFHSEKSPSFSVNRSKQFFHCFGCGVSGNAISFLIEFSHLSFVEAVEELAAFVGVDVPREQGGYLPSPQQDNLKELYQLLEQVAKFYAKQLRITNPQAQKAIDYLKARGVSGQIAKTFMLGYAPEQWDALLKHFPAKALLEVGLLVKNDTGKQYDRFRGRVMFPIRDKRGRVIGFGGRVLDDSQPKYMNSPESSVFTKGQHVYGIYELLQKNSKPQRILVVEGYMDVIALAQFGIDYAVATLGTATSKAHIDLLFRISSELVFCFDGDKAGQQAAWRATEAALPSLRDGRQVRIMLLPQGHDPDSLVRAEGVENFVQRVSSAQALSDYFFNHFTSSLDLTTMEGRAKLAATAKPYIEQLPQGIFRQMMEAQLKQFSQVAEMPFSQIPTTLNQNFAKPKPKVKKQLSLVDEAIALLLQYPHLAEDIVKDVPEWESIKLPDLRLLKNLLYMILNYHPANTGALIELYRGLDEEVIVKALANSEVTLPKSNLIKVISSAIDIPSGKINKDEIRAEITLLLEKGCSTEAEKKQLTQLNKMLIDKQ